VKPLALEDVSVTITPHQELEAPENWSGLSDSDWAADLSQWMADAEQNIWRWCCVELCVRFNDLSASVYLGQCAYDSEQDFMLDPYFPDMVDEALTELNELLQEYQRPSCGCVQSSSHELLAEGK
jgi:hypothetical protein